MDFFSILPLFSGVFRIIPIVIEFAADFHRQMLQNEAEAKAGIPAARNEYSSVNYIFSGETDMGTKHYSCHTVVIVVIHESYHLYTNQEDQYAFAVLDGELDTVVAFSVGDASVQVSNCGYDVNLDINVDTRLITIGHEPERE